MTLRGAPVLQEVAKDIETSALQAKMAQERQARPGDNDDGSHGIHNVASGSTASHRSRQGVSASGRPGMSPLLSVRRTSYIPACPSSMPFACGQDPATVDPVSAASLAAAAARQLRRPPRLPLAQMNTDTAATGSGRSAQSAQASADSADASGQQTQDAEGGNREHSASPNAANSSAPVTGDAAATGEAAVASNRPVLMIQSSAESGDRECYLPEGRESDCALGTLFTSGGLEAAFYDIPPAPLRHRTYPEDVDDRVVQERQAAGTQAASQNDNGVQHSSADTV